MSWRWRQWVSDWCTSGYAIESRRRTMEQKNLARVELETRDGRELVLQRSVIRHVSWQERSRLIFLCTVLGNLGSLSLLVKGGCTFRGHGGGHCAPPSS